MLFPCCILQHNWSSERIQSKTSAKPMLKNYKGTNDNKCTNALSPSILCPSNLCQFHISGFSNQPSSGLDFFAHSLGRKSPNLECFPTPLRSFDVQPPGDTTLSDTTTLSTPIGRSLVLRCPYPLLESSLNMEHDPREDWENMMFPWCSHDFPMIFRLKWWEWNG